LELKLASHPDTPLQPKERKVCCSARGFGRDNFLIERCS
jgi:hypothetical protein